MCSSLLFAIFLKSKSILEKVYHSTNVVQPRISFIYNTLQKQREKSHLVGVLEKKISKPYFGFFRRFRGICTYVKFSLT